MIIILFIADLIFLFPSPFYKSIVLSLNMCFSTARYTSITLIFWVLELDVCLQTFKLIQKENTYTKKLIQNTYRILIQENLYKKRIS